MARSCCHASRTLVESGEAGEESPSEFRAASAALEEELALAALTPAPSDVLECQT
ncbi:MAG: hypothetical protein ACREH3_01895 [Geminicoccales bacterium]